MLKPMFEFRDNHGQLFFLAFSCDYFDFQGIAEKVREVWEDVRLKEYHVIRDTTGKYYYFGLCEVL